MSTSPILHHLWSLQYCSILSYWINATFLCTLPHIAFHYLLLPDFLVEFIHSISTALLHFLSSVLSAHSRISMPAIPFLTAIVTYLGVECKHGLDGYAARTKTVCLEHFLDKLFPVLRGIHGWLCQKYLVFWRINLSVPIIEKGWRVHH